MLSLNLLSGFALATDGIKELKTQWLAPKIRPIEINGNEFNSSTKDLCNCTWRSHGRILGLQVLTSHFSGVEK